jgi:hypothetical protein
VREPRWDKSGTVTAFVRQLPEDHGKKIRTHPSASAAVRMNRLRRFIGTFVTIARPLTATEAKRKVVIPPRTAAGIATMAAANLAKIPATRRKKL